MSTEKEMDMDNISKGRHEQIDPYQLSEDMTQYRKYWMTQIMAGPAQGSRWSRKVGNVRKMLREGLPFSILGY